MADDEEVFEVEDLVDYRNVNGVDYFLVKWKGDNDQTWEPDENIGEALGDMKSKAKRIAAAADDAMKSGKAEPDDDDDDSDDSSDDKKKKKKKKGKKRKRSEAGSAEEDDDDDEEEAARAMMGMMPGMQQMFGKGMPSMQQMQ